MVIDGLWAHLSLLPLPLYHLYHAVHGSLEFQALLEFHSAVEPLAQQPPRGARQR